MGILEKIFGTKNQREINKIQPLVVRIADLGPTMEAKSDADLKAMTARFKEKLDNGASLDDIHAEAFAVVREAGKRVLGMRHYDVQMIGGTVLHQGRIAEMRTGEGKTLVATLPLYLNALTGKGVHLVTVNDYLARRDAEWMGQLYGWLGLSTGVIVHGLHQFERQRNYNCDITYGQNNEFGFDYLRDNMEDIPDRMVQRALNYAVVDEVDSILIDEARTPLIISGEAEQSPDQYHRVDKIIPRLRRDVDFVVDEKAHSAMLTDEGVERVEKLLSVENLYNMENLQLNHHVSQALKAHSLYKRDVNYVIEQGEIVIVDEHTGRKMPGRRWSDGLHQAIEAKEGVEVGEENETKATVTFQNFFRMYGKLSGMTGTADTEAGEFHEIYKLAVVTIPTNKPIIRKDQPDLVYKNERGKFNAVIADILDCHGRGQPVLVGTTSVEKSEVVASFLREKGVPFNVLNAKQHQREAGIVAQAGRKSAITISTNMAGRGTDILLGGNAEYMGKEALAAEKAAWIADHGSELEPLILEHGAADASELPSEVIEAAGFAETAREQALIAQFKTQCDAEKQVVLAAGGLRIIGTERHESRRIDNQLRGRAGRQGDPGASRFYLSLEDDLLRIFGLDRMSGLMERLGLVEDVPIESPMVTRSIEGAQKKVEGQNFDRRKAVLEYDDVMNQQRQTIYGLRRQVLEGRYTRTAEEVPDLVDHLINETKLARENTDRDTRKAVSELLTRIYEALGERDRKIAAGEEPDDGMPSWRIVRAELWRQFSALIDVEAAEKLPLDQRNEFIIAAVQSSIGQQSERLLDLCEDGISKTIEQYCPRDVLPEDWDLDALQEGLGELFSCKFSLEHGSQQELAEQAWHTVAKKLEERDAELTSPFLRYYARQFLLKEIDQQWTEHLKLMDALREGIHLQGYNQKDPKKEYKRAGFELFAEMMHRIHLNAVTNIFRVVRIEQQVPDVVQRERRLVTQGAAGKTDGEEQETETTNKTANNGGNQRRVARGGSAGGGAAEQGGERKGETVKRDRPKIGRNDPCHCGSGKKYKKCHGKDEADAAAE
ncbi:MAG: preprotein translocase subunit SecA [Myxococcales bacterium]|nr:preprotein translocase subunit SecA [Myxococcales bacterium]